MTLGYQATLGTALYRNGQFDEAREALLEAMDIDLNDQPFHLFLLAMTSWRLGERDDARSYYDRAVARSEATFPADPANRLYWQETAQLLGIQP